MEASAIVAIPETEVSARPRRRRFSAEEKRKILEEADACTKPGEVGALLRRKGLYSSYLSSWREARDRGELQALAPKKRGPKAKVPHPLERENAELKRALARAEARVKQAEGLVALQKKVADLLGIQLPREDETP